MTVSNNCKLETTFTTIKAVSSIAVLEIYQFYTNIAFLKEQPCISMHYDRVRQPDVFWSFSGAMKMEHWLKTWNYNTDRNNMKEKSFIKYYWIRHIFEVECDSL